MEQRNLSRNPKAPITASMAELSREGSTPRIFPISPTTRRFNSELPGYFNASCGLSIFRGDGLPDGYRGNAFACEPLSNLVHRDLLDSTGLVTSAIRPSEEVSREFLASSDPWFRPVNTATGPDGGLYILDFYRAWVEHPQFVANESYRNSVDFSEGNDYGRIYRVIAKQTATSLTDHPTNLASLPDESLMELLGHPNSWQRLTAQRLLCERGSIALRRLMLVLGESKSHLARYHAAGVLAQRTMDQESQTEFLKLCLKDSSPAVRRLGLKLIEQENFANNDVASFAVQMLFDPEVTVRFQALCSLGHRAAVKSIARLYLKDGGDPWFRQAIFASIGNRAAEFVGSLIEASDGAVQWDLEQLRWTLAVVESEADDPRWQELIDNTLEPDWRALILLGLARGQHPNQWSVAFQKSMDKPRAEYRKSLSDSLGRAEADSASSGADVNMTLSEDDQSRLLQLLLIGLLEFDNDTKADQMLAQALGPKQPLDVQQWAIEAIAKSDRKERRHILVDRLVSATPATRRALIDAILGHKPSVQQLADAIMSKMIAPSELDNLQRQLLYSSLAPETRSRLEELLQSGTGLEREKWMPSYLSVVEQAGDAKRGEQLFGQHCQSCHAIGGTGATVGPDLTSVAGRTAVDLATDILDPNRSVASNGMSYLVVTADDAILTGVIVGETATSITLRKAGGAVESVLRSEVQEFRSLGKSLMPEGFERALEPQQLSDLITFIRTRATAR